MPAVELKVVFPKINFNRPLWLAESPDGTKRLFAVEQAGRVLLLPADHESDKTEVFFDITDRKPFAADEEGLLGFAFHPKFKENRKFYVFYSQQDPKRTVISEFQASAADPKKVDMNSERILLEFPRPYWNHDGGCMVFGPDGYLYIVIGDGGKGGDPHNVGQSLQHLFAKILRIDVNSQTGKLPYGIPKDNPFVPQPGVQPPREWMFGMPRGEIWAYGLRNAWRVSFDKKTGELWAADVGQDKFEEVNIITKGGNYGWSVRESFHPYKDTAAGPSPAIDPIIEYGHSANLAKESKFPDHSIGKSITGGYVYRGSKLPKLQGVYIYGDYVEGTIWGLRQEGGKLTSYGTLVKRNPIRKVASFGEDLDGEVYVLGFDGKIYEFVEAAGK